MSLLLLYSEAAAGRTGDGGAQLTLAASGDASVLVAGAGNAVLSLAASGTAAALVQADGSAPLVLAGAGAGGVLVLADGAAPLTLAGAGDAGVRVTGDGSAPLTLAATGDGNTLGQVIGDGGATLALVVTGDGTVADALVVAATGGGFRPRRRPQQPLPPISADGSAHLTLVAGGVAGVPVRGNGVVTLPLPLSARGEADVFPSDESLAIAILLAAA